MPRTTNKPPLWACSRCGQRFVTRNMWHSCVRLTEAEFFGDRRAQRRLYRAYLKFVRQFGPVTVNITKTRISLQARVRFAGVPRVLRDGIVCGFWLKRRIESPRFLKVELIPPRDYIYTFKLTHPDQLDDEVAQWIAEAYRVGMQEEI
ncbi:MAG: DUF5655 domain-containing protein [Caulobacteraceae bacterium]